MKRLVFIALLVFSPVLKAYELGDFQGKWVIDSYKVNSSFDLVFGDGRDVWEFDSGFWSIYSSGKKVSSHGYSLKNNSIFIKETVNARELKINYFHDFTFLQIADGLVTYNLIRVKR